MSRSRQVAVVFEVSGETSGYDREWTLIDVNLPRARGRDAEESGWLIDSVQETVTCLPEALWGDEKDAPADVLAGGRFVAFGRERCYRSGWEHEEWDVYFEIESYRRLDTEPKTVV